MKQSPSGKSVYLSIAETLLENMRRARTPAGTAFYTRAEIADHFEVAPLTAERVLETLEKLHAIERGRGRRATVLQQSLILPTAPPGRRFRIILVCSLRETRTGFLRYLRERLEEDGNEVILSGVQQLLVENLAQYDAFVFLTLPAFSRILKEKLQAANRPYLFLTSAHMGKNILFLDLRYSVMQAALYLMRQRMRKLIVIPGTDPFLEAIVDSRHELRCDHYFHEYEYPCTVNRLRFLPANDDGILDILIQQLSEPAAKLEKTAILLKREHLVEPLLNRTAALNLRCQTDFQLLLFDLSAPVSFPLPRFNLMLPDLAEKCRKLIYRQMIAGSCDDFGDLHLPLFLEAPPLPGRPD